MDEESKGGDLTSPSPKPVNTPGFSKDDYIEEKKVSEVTPAATSKV